MMRSTLKIVRLIIMVISGVCGTFLNSFIVGLNFRFLRDVTISGGYNKIIFAIGLVNIIFQGFLIFDTIFETFELYLAHKNLILSMFSLEFTLIGTNIWNTTLLSVFCAFRLVNSSHWFFLKIKSKLLTFLPHLIVGSVFFSVAIDFPIFWMTTVGDVENGTHYQTISGRMIIVDSHYVIACSIIGFFVPISMTCVSIGLCVTTLLTYIWRIGNSDSHITSDQLQGHYRAVRTMVGRLILDIFFFLVPLLGLSVTAILNSLVHSFLWMIVLMYPASQAFILIFGNPKLKTAAYGLIKAFR